MTIGIVGLGLIGGSMAKAFKFYTDNTVLAFDRDVSAIKRAKLVCATDDELTDENIGTCDVIIIALYPQATVDFVLNKGALFKKGALVFDCCGIKRPICAACFEAAEKYGFEFYGGHPMAGTQFSGFKNARETMFKNASMIIVPRSADDIYKLESIKEIFTPIGFKTITVTDADTHDRIISYTSQLAHVVSNAYVKSPSAKVHRGFSAGSFKDLTRVAKLNEDMWTELFMKNGDFLANEIDRIADEMKKYSAAIKNNDAAALKALLKEGNEAKELSQD